MSRTLPLLTCLLLISLNAFAQSPVDQQIPIDSAVCKADQSTITQRTKLQLEPNYFAKLYAVRNVATIIASLKTYTVNLANGKLVNMQGTYDPVPTPDERFLATIDSTDGPHYFQTTDLLDRPAPADGYHSWTSPDFNLSYAYQSLGWIQGVATGPYTYRFLDDNDNGSVSFRDDYFTVPAGGKMADASIHTSSWVHACANLNATMKLPMIAKDGKKIAFYNVDRNVTQVYDMDSKGTCSNGQNLPFITGKADFSFDGNEIAFHMGRIQEPSQWFENADPARKLDTYTYNLKTRRLTRLTDVVHGNAYFPTFKKMVTSVSYFRRPRTTSTEITLTSSPIRLTELSSISSQSSRINVTAASTGSLNLSASVC